MEKDVTRHIEEQLSAFLDGELPEEELALLVRRLERDENFRSTLDRYALIGGALRNETDLAGGLKMRRDVMAALDENSADVPPAAAEKSVVAKGSRAPYLLAASALVGVMAVFFGAGFTPQTSELSQPVAAVSQPVAEIQPQAPAVVSVAAKDPEREARRERHQQELRRIRINQERMRSYLISHGEYASPLQGAIADSRMYVQQASFSE